MDWTGTTSKPGTSQWEWFNATTKPYHPVARLRRLVTQGNSMIKRKKPTQATKQRSVRRCPLVASADVTEPLSGTRLSARTSEIGLGGCYVDALNPLPEGTLVGLRIL
jgi:hypothetical protein